MTDPPRAEIENAITLTQQAGIGVKMITGDNPLTAKAIGSKIGLGNEQVIEGKDIEHLEGKELEQIVDSHSIFARVSPVHKYKIVDALVKRDIVVAVTGDGVNDAPALKKANIGIAMGIKGTDVAKESSDLVLKDDDFSTIVIAIREGRRIYSNIKNFTKYMLSVNFSEIGIVIFTTLMRLPLPYLPLQILWLNLATDSLPALSLGSEKGSRGLMQQKPRAVNESIFHKVKGLMIVTAIVAIAVTLIGYGIGLQEDAVAGIDPFDLDSPSHARTLALTTLIVFELFFVFNCREEGKTAFELNPLTNLALLASVLISLLLHILIVYSEFFSEIFHFVPISLEEWGIIFLLGVTGLFTPYLNRGIRYIIPKKK